MPIKKDIIDSELISLVSENIENAQNWKDLATYLKMDEETVSFIETETTDVNQQCNKILQLWKVGFKDFNIKDLFYFNQSLTQIGKRRKKSSP